MQNSKQHCPIPDAEPTHQGGRDILDQTAKDNLFQKTGKDHQDKSREEKCPPTQALNQRARTQNRKFNIS
jgi:hypothetical protein